MNIWREHPIGEWSDENGHHRIIKLADGGYLFQSVFEEGWDSRPIDAHKVWEIFPEAAPGWWREQRYQQWQASRRERVWWRRLMRQAPPR